MSRKRRKKKETFEQAWARTMTAFFKATTYRGGKRKGQKRGAR